MHYNRLLSLVLIPVFNLFFTTILLKLYRHFRPPKKLDNSTYCMILMRRHNTSEAGLSQGIKKKSEIKVEVKFNQFLLLSASVNRTIFAYQYLVRWTFYVFTFLCDAASGNIKDNFKLYFITCFYSRIIIL